MNGNLDGIFFLCFAVRVCGLGHLGVAAGLRVENVMRIAVGRLAYRKLAWS